MVLRRLKLTNYKNYPSVDVAFNSMVNVFTGDNGSGKTNLLDAIYQLSFCKSNFQHQDSLLVNDGNDFFRMEGYFECEPDHLQMAISFSREKKKQIQVDDKKLSKLSEHIGKIPLVFIGPRDIHLILEGSAERRKLLDTGISQLNKEYLQNLVLYNKVLMRRNAYLKSCQYNQYDNTMIESFNEQLLQPASIIFEERKRFVESFTQTFAKSYQLLSGDKEKAGCQYTSQLHQDSFNNLLAESINKDVILQRTTKGVHKDDLKFTLNEKSLKRFGSEGQLKTYLLALKLSMWKELNAKLQKQPILLLDDIFAKLDNHRVKNLLYFVHEECKAQVFISDTHADRVSDILAELNLNHLVFTIHNNEVNVKA